MNISNESPHERAFPKTNISLIQALNFCERLSVITNLPVRLPTVDEWVLAAKNEGKQKSEDKLSHGGSNLKEWCLDDPDPIVRRSLLRNYYGLLIRSENTEKKVNYRKENELVIHTGKDIGFRIVVSMEKIIDVRIHNDGNSYHFEWI